jgi:hypothetical protein
MRNWLRAIAGAGCALAAGVASAAIVPEASRFDALVVHDPSATLGVVAGAPEQVDGWSVWTDRRTGTPMLAQGSGLRWFGESDAVDARRLESFARDFATAGRSWMRIDPSQLVLDTDGSGAIAPGRWVVVFDRAIGGVPVEGERLTFYVNRGNLVAFGADRWGTGAPTGQPRLERDAALTILRAYMGLEATDRVETVRSGSRSYIAVPGAEGAFEHRLAWSFALRVDGERGTWVGKVDADSGRVLAFYDEHLYASVEGGVYPLSNDQNCADGGCEIGGYPMPYIGVTVGRTPVSTGDMGVFGCSKGAKRSEATLTGPYVRTQDLCGNGVVSGSCTSGIDFGTSTGTDCTSPQGTSGNTHAARTAYYHLNRIKEKARFWLPANTWVTQQLISKPNTSGTCNAFWNGSVNFYRSGGGCRNAGEIAGVVNHEYGHGLDQNDGGGYDNPSEAYGDVIAILQERNSCVGRGFFQGGTCSGYGDSCLTCSGIRDMDFAARARNTPATPQNFTGFYCGGGGGPCGREVHCESYVPSEAIYDLATRDLPASGLDADTSWQLAERLFYQSRQGSGGAAFNCTAGGAYSDGCNASSWFNKLRNADDDDGNLANGTPHAAAIYSAFARHNIACGTAADVSNLNGSGCPTLAKPTISTTAGTGAVTVSWSAVAGASSYYVLRSEVGCDFSQNVVATVASPATSYVDDGLPAGLPVYYRVQARGADDACESPVSACVSASGL